MDSVRDYEGSQGVNAAIATTLAKAVSEDFWMLNNGVTVVATQARTGHRSLGLKDPKIVNGLQTTVEIYRHFRSTGARDDRLILVRVVIPTSDSSRNRIIVATNSQTPISKGVLKATDLLHRDIEEFLVRFGYFYERRRNAYRYEGRSLDTIITMPFLMRSMTAVALLEPHWAVRADAEHLLANGRLYGSVFSADVPLIAYLNAIRIMKAVAQLGRSGLVLARHDDVRQSDLSQQPPLSYLHWHVGAAYAMRSMARTSPDMVAFAGLDVGEIDREDLQSALALVQRVLLPPKRNKRKTQYRNAKSASSASGLAHAIGLRLPQPIHAGRQMRAEQGARSDCAPATCPGSDRPRCPSTFLPISMGWACGPSVDA